MARTIFVNLPVADLARAVTFYEALGFGRNPDFSDDTAACMVVDEHIFVMLLTEPKFKGFINGDIAAPDVTEVLNCLTVDDAASVEQMRTRALAAGGSPWQDTVREGPMHYSTFADPDGHVWEILAMGAPD